VHDHGVVSVDAEHADLQQVAIACRANTHREVVIESPLPDGVANGVTHILVCDPMLSSRLCDPHDDKISCQEAFVKESCRVVTAFLAAGVVLPRIEGKYLEKANSNQAPRQSSLTVPHSSRHKAA
jgi:hypothetical protein